MTADGITRRQTLTGVAAVGVATPLLAACGGDEESTTAVEPPPAGEQLGATSEIPVGGGKIYSDKKIVVTQPSEGEFRAFSAVCPHQGCLVSRVSEQTVDCLCHGSKFGLADGEVVTGPANASLPEVSITVEGDTISTA